MKKLLFFGVVVGLVCASVVMAGTNRYPNIYDSDGYRSNQEFVQAKKLKRERSCLKQNNFKSSHQGSRHRTKYQTWLYQLRDL